MRARFHPTAWLIWFAAALTPLLLTGNPLYLLVLVLVQALNLSVLEGEESSRGWRPVLLLALWIVPLTLLFNVLTVHYGRHVWARLPHAWPIIGGPLTGEALLFGVSRGLSLLALLLTFAVFNAEMPPSRWLRLVPGAFFQAGLVTAIAITFVPATVAAAQDIYRAQRLRGHTFRRVTDYAPLFAPLVVDSLERSVQLAQSMASRGFGAAVRPPSRGQQVLLQLGLWGALLLAFLGLILTLMGTGSPTLRRVPLLLAAGLFLLVLHLYGRRVRRTVYRRWYWRSRDTLLAAGSLILLLIFWGVRLAAPRHWFYYPYPPYSLVPDFSWVPGVALTFLALPALLSPSSHHRRGGRV